MEDKTYIITLRAKSTPHKLEAATHKTVDGWIIFTNAKGEETGKFYEPDVMGFSVEPDMPTITF
jgi:hypothetical protein